ncbi:hypothetical protein PCASD_26435 [Puccinia coronata f. sp. avenae]|uniref:Uncharacterized protein n=1 Tax=Puccinia coronata f. sp. avenae TaxID=200324 RepID=A0A2N5THJ9_9BASI|nr:hypothetical protein PCASD_26435 [Puccinia coronata f. sp. avenae]
MSSLVEKWEPALITNNQIKEQVLTPISTTSKYYEPMIKATNWFAAKDIQLKWNEEAAKKGIPLNEVPKIREIWAEHWKHLGQDPIARPWNNSPSPGSSPGKKPQLAPKARGSTSAPGSSAKRSKRVSIYP